MIQSGVWQEQPHCASPQGPLPVSGWAGSIMVPARLSSSPAQTLLTPRTGSAQPQNHRVLSSHFPQDWITSAPLRIRSPQFLHDCISSAPSMTESSQTPPGLHVLNIPPAQAPLSHLKLGLLSAPGLDLFSSSMTASPQPLQHKLPPGQAPLIPPRLNLLSPLRNVSPQPPLS